MIIWIRNSLSVHLFRFIICYFIFSAQKDAGQVQSETGLGAIDVQALINQTGNLKGRGKYNQWTEENRFEIVDYAR